MTPLDLRVTWPRGRFVLSCDEAIPVTGVTALFGRSGCGKSSLLRVVAGLERVPGAQVSFNGECWQSADGGFVRPEQRRVGLVFQEHSLLPHLSVRDNLLYGWKRTPPALRRLQLTEVADMLGIADLLEVAVDQLSGGQGQRVALGRALLSSPRLLLLDEPLAALDVQTKREIMPFLSRLSHEAGVPMLLITHSPDEVQRLADHVVFMSEGAIQQVCSLQQAMASPDSPLFADEGPASVLTGTVSSLAGSHEYVFGSEAAQLFLPAPVSSEAGASQTGRQRIRVLARDVSVALDNPERISIRNHLWVTIQEIHALPDKRVLLTVRLADGQRLLAELTAWSAQALNLQVGQQVWALIKSVALLV